MKKHTEPVQPDTFYHVYNRGNNGEDIFKLNSNYPYFLQRYATYIEPVAETFAYCLLKNHFHLLIRTKSEDEILKYFYSKVDEVLMVDEIQNLVNLNANLKYLKSASYHISNQFAKLFNGYTQAINKQCGRTGGLFETPFRRIEVKDDSYFTQLIWYIHFNPQKHGFVDDFREYEYSSYRSHLTEKATRLSREQVWSWFGSKEAYETFHVEMKSESEIQGVLVE